MHRVNEWSYGCGLNEVIVHVLYRTGNKVINGCQMGFLSGDHLPKVFALSNTSLYYADMSASGATPTCPVCLKRLIGRKSFQELGKPQSCDHFFCFACILEWSKVSQLCSGDTMYNVPHLVV